MYNVFFVQLPEFINLLKETCMFRFMGVKSKLCVVHLMCSIACKNKQAIKVIHLKEISFFDFTNLPSIDRKENCRLFQ